MEELANGHLLSCPRELNKACLTFFCCYQFVKKIFLKIFAILAISTDVDENDQNAKDNFTATNLIEGSSLVEGVTGDGKKHIEQGVIPAPES